MRKASGVNSRVARLAYVMKSEPQAVANVTGSSNYSGIQGNVRFYSTGYGTLVVAEVYGLPVGDMPCGGRFFGFHIHSGAACTGNSNDPFANALTHYNPNRCAHPHHAGDMPPLLGNMGYAFSAFITNRFSVRDVLGKTVIIHSGVDDFTTDPSGNAGEKMACGRIEPFTGNNY